MRRWLGAGDEFWRLVEKLTYFVLFPALLLHRLATTPLPDSGLGGALAALLIPALAVTVIGLIARRPLGLDGPDFATATMGAIRFNTYAGLAGALALFGQEGVAVFALLLAVKVPFVNVLSVVLLGRYAGGRAIPARALARAIATNPLVLACAAGLAINLGGLPVPDVAERSLAILGNAALGIGLLAVGAALRLGSLVAGRRALAITTVAKLALMPALVALACWMFEVGDLERGVVILFAGLPSSPAAYVLPRQMGGNAPLMAGIITVSTPAAMVAFPAALVVFG